jgi:valyl-tRNA synthetase
MVRAIRNIRTEMQIPPQEKTELLLFGPSSREKTLAENHTSILLALTPTLQVSFVENEPSSFGATAMVGHLKLFIPIPESLKGKETARLEKEREKLEKLIESTTAKLSNPDFKARAPAEIVQKLEHTLAQSKKQLQDIIAKLKS